MRKHAAKVLALVVVIPVWGLTTLPTATQTERQALARPFQFTAVPVSPQETARTVRPVAKPYENIRAWISSVGAGVGLFSADDKVVARDICLVDPRTDTVTVRPAVGDRYRPLTLKAPGAKPYEAPMGCLPADLNEDGRQDVLVYYWGRSPVMFLRTQQTFRAVDLVTPPQIWNTNAATLGDYDGDGHLDVVFGNYFKDGARVLDPTADQPELNMTGSLSDAHNGGTNRLFRFVRLAPGNAPIFEPADGVFDKRQAQAWTLALGTQDVNGDGRPDLYVANDFAPDRLLVNESAPGRIRFREHRGTRGPVTPKSKVIGNDSFKGMGVAFSDLNHDQVPDILVSNITEPFALQESNFAFVSNGEGGWDDRSEDLGLSRTGWSWDVKAADFDNDGSDEVMHATGFVRGEVDRWAQLQEAATSNDLILGHPGLWPNLEPGDDLSGRNTNSFFVRGADGRFVDVARQAGVGTDAVSRGFAVGDVDTDGRLDFVVANQWAPSVLYRNQSRPGPFLGLRLRVPVGTCFPQTGRTAESGAALGRTAAVSMTRPAIGAAARIALPGGGLRTQQLYPANGHGGVSAPELLFGLGAASAAIKTELSWRDSCGLPRSAALTLSPGWHTIVLSPEGSAKEAS